MKVFLEPWWKVIEFYSGALNILNFYYLSTEVSFIIYIYSDGHFSPAKHLQIYSYILKLTILPNTGSLISFFQPSFFSNPSFFEKKLYFHLKSFFGFEKPKTSLILLLKYSFTSFNLLLSFFWVSFELLSTSLSFMGCRLVLYSVKPIQFCKITLMADIVLCNQTHLQGI